VETAAGLALALSSVAGALAAGEGFPLRHLVEGMFGYLDAVLIIVTSVVAMGMFLWHGTV
jgi:gluconate:H+ symporter, GntP family